jgi:maltose alpha-D-glucosyltransferase/alpha-amylase
VELDLQSFRGMIPVEMFGGTSFPQIQDGPLFLSLGPHSFYWFGLVAPTPQDETVEISGSRPPVLRVRATWEEIAAGKPKAELEKILAGYLPAQRWFAGKARAIKGVRILDLLAVNRSRHPALFLIVQVDYLEGDPDRYHVPLAYASGESADAVVRDHIGAVVAFVEQSGPETGILYDATLDARFCRALLDAIRRRSRWKARGAEITTTTTPALRSLWTDERGALEPTLLRKEQSNTSVAYGDRLLLKMFRRLPPGTNPDLEIGTFLTRRGFAHIPPVAGGIEYRRGKEPVTLAILEGYVRNQGDAWTYTLDMLSNYFEQIITQRPDPDAHPLPQIDALSLDGTLPENISQTLGGYTETAQLLGQRTAALHRSLFDAKGDPAFEPEPFSKLYQRALYQSLRTLTRQALGLLHNRLGTVPEELVPAAEHVLREGNRIMDFFWSVTREKLTAVRMRCHGDYHLGQVLYTGKDFVIMDFEGEPARPISERRIKRSPLRDVAGMVRSFHYAASTGLVSLRERGLVPDDDLPVMEFWAAFWHNWISAVFLSAYRKTSEGGGFLPHSLDELRFLLDIYLLEKAVYELSYELNNRPAWVKIPLDGIQQLLAGLPEES